MREAGMAQTSSLGARAHAAGRARHAWLGAMTVMAMVEEAEPPELEAVMV